MSFHAAPETPEPHGVSSTNLTGSIPAEVRRGVTSQKRSKRAARAIGALPEITEGVAHDFRNILCVIESALNVAEGRPLDLAKLGAAFSAIRHGVERGKDITSRLLAFAKHQDLEARPEDVNLLLRQLNVFLRYGAGPGIRVIQTLAPDLPKCFLDAHQFNLAMLNLVANARDAMPREGEIRITTRTVTDQANLTYVRLRVCDNGTGMAPDVTSKVFDPYFTTKGDGGTGLGVPQVEAFMRHAGGYLTVRSAIGKGTSFDLFFPAPRCSAVVLDVRRQLDRWTGEGGATAVQGAGSSEPVRCLRNAQH